VDLLRFVPLNIVLLITAREIVNTLLSCRKVSSVGIIFILLQYSRSESRSYVSATSSILSYSVRSLRFKARDFIGEFAVRVVLTDSLEESRDSQPADRFIHCTLGFLTRHGLKLRTFQVGVGKNMEKSQENCV
jgi:hypothetical protein